VARPPRSKTGRAVSCTCSSSLFRPSKHGFRKAECNPLSTSRWSHPGNGNAKLLAQVDRRLVQRLARVLSPQVERVPATSALETPVDPTGHVHRERPTPSRLTAVQGARAAPLLSTFRRGLEPDQVEHRPYVDRRPYRRVVDAPQVGLLEPVPWRAGGARVRVADDRGRAPLSPYFTPGQVPARGDTAMPTPAGNHDRPGSQVAN